MGSSMYKLKDWAPGEVLETRDYPDSDLCMFRDMICGWIKSSLPPEACICNVRLSVEISTVRQPSKVVSYQLQVPVYATPDPSEEGKKVDVIVTKEEGK